MFAPRSGRYLALGIVGVAALALASIVLAPERFPLTAFAVAALAAWGFFATFFRDPERTVGDGIVAAADGRVLAVTTEGGRVRIAVFMNVTNVHVNRAPLDGEVTRIERAGEGHRPAYAADASHNRRCHYEFATAIGTVEVVQMTGLVARRLVPLVRVGDTRRRGERFGMIVMGSRVDVLLPDPRVEVVVRARDRVVAGVTTIARVRP
ncbi:MAG: phosphatidylserine decarboxylase [Thermoplasmata archaeon]